MNKFKILIITSEYPNKYDLSTPVVHYYAKEWLAQGHEIKVIYFRTIFPFIFYFGSNFLLRYIKFFFRTDNIPLIRINKSFEYDYDGISVIYQPIFKIFPHFNFFKRTIKKNAKIIYNNNLDNNFTPDLIISHFVNPQLPIIFELKKYYPNVKTSFVLHENPKVISNLFGSRSKKFLNNLDYIGFRHNEMRIFFYNLFGKEYKTFICYSGIPENYILSESPKNKFTGEKISFCFAGMLIPLKNIDVILEALNLAFPERNFTFEIIGQGMLNKKISKKISELKLEGCVTMLGKLSREEVKNKMYSTDVFVMVSKPEAFGLVYVEAMSQGCITIGAKRQGIDGVIEHGKNGFLCEARNVKDLKNIFMDINQMSYDDKIYLANNAIKTASLLTNRKVADNYLKIITSQL